MNCTCQSAVCAEREAICKFLEGKGQRINAERIRRGDHHRELRVVDGTSAPRPRGMEDHHGGWYDGEDGA